MQTRLEAIPEAFPIAGRFVISRGAKTEAHVVRVTITQGAFSGHGECVPYGRYGETVESVLAEIERHRLLVESGKGRLVVNQQMSAGAARNAIDCALWDLEAKKTGTSPFASAGIARMKPVVTAYTLSLGTPDEMGDAARKASGRAMLKIKVGGDGDIERLAAVRGGAPDARIIVDANEGWNDSTVETNLLACKQFGVALVEQPLPAGKDAILSTIEHPVPVCADESVHTSKDLAALADRYDAVNIKLDKAGGLTEALEMNRVARSIGLNVMIGCMVGTSLGMAPALAIAQTADFVDLDGPLLLARDRVPSLTYEGSLILPPPTALWG
jgi:L-alanine-DL-glutamate epimerase-like enolase superfamily enzyme